jgi:hypothetical protein
VQIRNKEHEKRVYCHHEFCIRKVPQASYLPVDNLLVNLHDQSSRINSFIVIKLPQVEAGKGVAIGNKHGNEL